MSDIVRAYHFVGDTLRDGRPVPPDGAWLVHDGPIVMCESGLHASRHPFDALTYAPASVLCLVDVRVDIVEEGDKLVGRERRIVSRADMTDDLRLFARQCASDVLHLWDAPDMVREYLETGREDLRAAARAAAWAAARDAAWDAASAAARDAARAAASAAAWDAASAAARAAAWAAARAAARAAASAAAWDAAWDAARDDQRTRFASMVGARFGGHDVS